MELADREEGLGALGQGLADPDEDAGGERDRQAPGVLDSTRRRTAGTLSGDPKCGPPRCDRRSEEVSSIIPIDGATCFSRAISS